MSGTILSPAGWNTSGFLGEHSVSDKSLACGCGIRRVKEVKHSTLSAFSYFVLKIRASEGRKEVRGLGMKGGIRKRGRACPKRGGRLHWVPCENFPLLHMVLIKSRYSIFLLWVRGGARGGDMYVCVCVYVCLCACMYVCVCVCVCVYFPGGTSGKEPACQCTRLKRRGFDP